MEIQKTKLEVLSHFPQTIDIDFLIKKKKSTFSGSSKNAERLTHRLNEWCKSAAGQDWTIFGERILLDGLRYEELIEKLSKTAISNKNVFHDPIWKNAVWVYASLTSPNAKNDDCDLLNLIFKQLIKHAKKKAGRGIQIKHQIEYDALEKLSKNLVDDILSICYESLLKQMEGQANTSFDDGFEVYMQKHGWKAIFQAHPVMLRLISSVVTQWIEGTRELIFRITTDFEEVVRVFFENQPKLHIIDFKCNSTKLITGS